MNSVCGEESSEIITMIPINATYSNIGKYHQDPEMLHKLQYG